MGKYVRKFAIGLGILALLVTLFSFKSDNGYAANLTGGVYTYVINGDEATFPVDPVKVSGGLLLPVEVYQQLGVILSGGTTRTPVLKKGEVTARLTLGSLQTDVNGTSVTTPSTPTRLNGRLFVPVELMKEFGYDVTQDSNFIAIRSYTPSQVPPVQMADATYASLKGSHTIATSLKADSGSYMTTEFTLLSPEIVNTTNFGGSYGMRAKLLNLLQTNTLIMVKVSNNAIKSGTIPTAGLSLVDNQRNQYDVQQVIDMGSGLITTKIAPGADRTSVLQFARLATGPNVNPVWVYYDSNGGTVGSFNP